MQRTGSTLKPASPGLVGALDSEAPNKKVWEEALM